MQYHVLTVARSTASLSLWESFWLKAKSYCISANIQLTGNCDNETSNLGLQKWILNMDAIRNSVQKSMSMSSKRRWG